MYLMNVYVLRSLKDNRFYVGMSADIEKRIQTHNSGNVKSTKGYRPWELIHQESFPDRITARKREKYLKSGYGKQWLKEKYN
ncbi:GIY-YIG nuclease family protein [Flavobacteriaceae bacterium R38]|nr:GIY-YIG nuclease family protein [Flavobacteriaceae bacterium R38]